MRQMRQIRHWQCSSLRKTCAHGRFAPRNRVVARVEAPDSTTVRDDRWTGDLMTRFQAADLDGNGTIDREEFRRLIESTGNGSEYLIFHWLSDDEVDQLFDKYAADGSAIPFEGFKSLAEDGVLLQGRLSEYQALFETCPSFDSGTVTPACIDGLAGRLEKPLTPNQVSEALRANVGGGDERGGDRLSFGDFLRLFKDKLLDLHQITEYLKLEEEPAPEISDEEAAAAANLVPDLQPGKPYVIDSSEKFDAVLALHPDKLVVLLAGLSWCRPCKSLTRPLEKLAEHYRDGAVFLKILGDTNDNTKRFFKNRLSVKATPHLSFHRNGKNAYSRTGANKTLLEEALRRFYNTDKYDLPDSMLYPETVKTGATN